MSRAHPASSLAIGMAVWLIGSLGCIREPLPNICPNVEEGELVISELRGSQDKYNGADDSFGHYLEIYNAANKTVDMQGLHIRIRPAGAEERVIFVRESIEIAAGDYFVVGPGLPDDPEAWMDYAVGWDISGGDYDRQEEGIIPRDFLKDRSAFIELDACGDLIDEMFYDTDALPKLGTLACGNAENPPSADTNDESASGCWCIDALETEGLFGLGLPGTPGGSNRCP